MNSTKETTSMKGLTDVQKRLFDLASCLHWFTRDQLVMFATGEVKRHSQIERLLPVLVKKGFLKSIPDGHRYLYATSDRFNVQGLKIVYHGLGCSESIVRLMRCDLTGEIISEQVLSSFKNGVIPDFGILYRGKKLILCEFTTWNNATQWKGNITSKLSKYRGVFSIYKDIFEVEPIVLFIFDTSREVLEKYLKKYKQEDRDELRGPFMFVLFDELKYAPIGEAMKESIYTWGADSKNYPLKNGS